MATATARLRGYAAPGPEPGPAPPQRSSGASKCRQEGNGPARDGARSHRRRQRAAQNASFHRGTPWSQYDDRGGMLPRRLIELVQLSARGGSNRAPQTSRRPQHTVTTAPQPTATLVEDPIRRQADLLVDDSGSCRAALLVVWLPPPLNSNYYRCLHRRLKAKCGATDVDVRERREYAPFGALRKRPQ